MFADVVAIIVTRARKSDELPSRHVAVAAIDRIGEEAFHRVGQNSLEKVLAAAVLKLDLAGLKALQDLILLRRRAPRRFCRRRSPCNIRPVPRARGGNAPLARLATAGLAKAFPLRTAAHVERPRVAKSAGELPINKDRTARPFATGTGPVGRNQPIDDRLDRGSFVSSEIKPGAGPYRDRWRCVVRFPRQAPPRYVRPRARDPAPLIANIG